ncbi:metallophosphoesterase family protein [Leptospira adleri]|uniref:Calcineurin n=1 Tax=Leptospira adleri TaxID=2023186 RepID=A0A2M9YJ97_9LEPT|nr:metallophosphoesterase [Leptospira adleri]PJZ51612.1 calcineurin [Leptospira adleri]PJZ61879.1 calcineurin [Leptospira adleri]
MIVGQIADIHLRGGEGTEEAVALMKAAGIFIEKGCKIVCVNGDIFEDVSDPEQRLVFRIFLDTLHSAGITTIILRGNHDKPKDLRSFKDKLNPLCYEFDKPGHIVLPDSLERIQVFALPHFGAGALALQNQSIEDFHSKGNNLIVDLLEDWFQKIRNYSGPSLVLFHGTVSGAVLDNKRIPRNNGMFLPQTILDSFGCPVVGGHYHFCQKIGKWIWYSGSTTRQTWGEAEDDKGILIWEIEEGSWRLEPDFISLNPAPMRTVNLNWDGENLIDKESGKILEPSEFKGKIRIRLDVPESLSHSVPKKLESFFPNATELKPERNTISTVAVRSEEIGSVESIEDGVIVYFRAKNKPESEIHGLLEEYRMGYFEMTEGLRIEESVL